MSNVEGNLRVCSFGIGLKYTYFISKRYKHNESHTIQKGCSFICTKLFRDPFDYYVEKFREIFSKRRVCTQLHSFIRMKVGKKTFGELRENSDVFFKNK